MAFISAAICATGFWSASFTTTVSKPASMATALPMFTWPLRTILSPAKEAFRLGKSRSASAAAFNDEVVDRQLAVFAHQGVELLAQDHGGFHVHFAVDIELRHGLLQLGHAPGDDLAHAGQRHFHVVVRDDNRGGRGARRGRSRRGGRPTGLAAVGRGEAK